MAKADRKHFGAGAQGKGDGTGAMTELEDEKVRKSRILSNRDKVQDATEERGLDTANVRNESFHDHAGNRRPDRDPKRPEGEG